MATNDKDTELSLDWVTEQVERIYQDPVPQSSKDLEFLDHKWAVLLDTICGEKYWAQMIPDSCKHESVNVDIGSVHIGRDKLIHEGYTLCQGVFKDTMMIEQWRNAVTRIVRHGWPPVFVYMVPSLWCMNEALHTVVTKHLDKHLFPTYDLLAFWVDPNRDKSENKYNSFVLNSGFSPHRDRQPDTTEETFFHSGVAKYNTFWIPLTKATSDNSSLFVLPACYDPGYKMGDVDDEDPMWRAIPEKTGFQNIRSLACEPPNMMLFTHRILHWGSNGSKFNEDGPRIAVSFTFSSMDFEPSYIHDPARRGSAPKSVEMSLLAGQVLMYQDRYESLTLSQTLLFWKMFERNANHFDASYIRKVKKELVAAVDACINRLGIDTNRLELMVDIARDLSMEVLLSINEDFDDDFEGVGIIADNSDEDSFDGKEDQEDTDHETKPELKRAKLNSS